MAVLHSGILRLVLVEISLLVVVVESGTKKLRRMLILSMNSKDNNAIRLIDDRSTRGGTHQREPVKPNHVGVHAGLVMFLAAYIENNKGSHCT